VVVNGCRRCIMLYPTGRFDPTPFSPTDGVQLAVTEREGKPHAVIKRLLAADPSGAGGPGTGVGFVPLGGTEADLEAKLKVVVACGDPRSCTSGGFLKRPGHR
jgi:hypothetical protein